MEICAKIVFRAEQNIAPSIFDEQTIWALEDLSEHYQVIGDLDTRRFLLQEAYGISIRLWPEGSSSTVCISGKIETLKDLSLARSNGLGRTSRFVSLLAARTTE